MNKSNFRLFGSIGAALVLVFAASSALAQDCKATPRNPANIDVEVVNGVPQFANELCGGSGGKGDICNAPGSLPRIKFKLRGDEGRDWEFSGMQLGAGGAWPGTLPAGAIQDFDVDATTGMVAVDINGSENQMEARNDNCNQFDVNYRIELIGPQGQRTWLHPVIKNGGRG